MTAYTFSTKIAGCNVNLLKTRKVTVEKIWLQSYPEGVPAEINPDAHDSLVDIFETMCQKYADRPAFYNLGTTITFRELKNLAGQFATYLQQALHLKKGDRIAIMMPNLLQYPIAVFGALQAGLVVVNVNPLYTVPELVHQLKDSGAETILVLSNYAKTVQDAMLEIPLKNIIITHLGDCLAWHKALTIHVVLKYIQKKIPAYHIPQALYFKDVMSDAKNFSFAPVDVSNIDIAFLQYTGGTTGISKGAVLTHRNLVANILQAHAWFKPLLTEQQEIIITALPLYHIFSLLANCLFFSEVGGFNILITNPRDIPFMISEMRKFKFTAITGVNTLFNSLLKNPKFASLDFSRLKFSLGGGMSVQKVVAEKWKTVTGNVLLEAYGLTETSPCVTVNPVNLKEWNGTVGLPVSSTDVAILDEEEKELPVNTAGELAVKGPQVMRGYWRNSRETQKVFTKAGWLLTGDIASVNEKGFVKILERKKDMILVSGFNVYPNEIEDVLVRIPGIHEAAVVGVPDENSGEAVKAVIVKDNPALTEKEILNACHKMLTGYKVPKYIEFRTDLPKTNVGKILRRALRESVDK